VQKKCSKTKLKKKTLFEIYLKAWSKNSFSFGLQYNYNKFLLVNFYLEKKKSDSIYNKELLNPHKKQSFLRFEDIKQKLQIHKLSSLDHIYNHWQKTKKWHRNIAIDIISQFAYFLSMPKRSKELNCSDLKQNWYFSRTHSSTNFISLQNIIKQRQDKTVSQTYQKCTYTSWNLN